MALDPRVHTQCHLTGRKRQEVQLLPVRIHTQYLALRRQMVRILIPFRVLLQVRVWLLQGRICRLICLCMCGREQHKEVKVFMNIIFFLAGACLGIPLGWVLLFLLVMCGGNKNDPPTKEEWKVM